jgi:hypothetical protein
MHRERLGARRGPSRRWPPPADSRTERDFLWSRSVRNPGLRKSKLRAGGLARDEVGEIKQLSRVAVFSQGGATPPLATVLVSPEAGSLRGLFQGDELMRFRLWMCGAAALVLMCDLAQAGRQRSRCRSAMTSCVSAPACGCPPTCACAPGECAGLAGAIADGCARSKSVTSTSSVDCVGGECRSRTVTKTSSTTSVAQWKADQLAARCQMIQLGPTWAESRMASQS